MVTWLFLSSLKLIVLTFNSPLLVVNSSNISALPISFDPTLGDSTSCYKSKELFNILGYCVKHNWDEITYWKGFGLHAITIPHIHEVNTSVVLGSGSNGVESKQVLIFFHSKISSLKSATCDLDLMATNVLTSWAWNRDCRQSK